MSRRDPSRVSSYPQRAVRYKSQSHAEAVVAAAKAEANSERIFMSSFYFESLKLFLERFKRLAF